MHICVLSRIVGDVCIICFEHGQDNERQDDARCCRVTVLAGSRPQLEVFYSMYTCLHMLTT